MVLLRLALLVCCFACVSGVRVFRNQQSLQDEMEIAKAECSAREFAGEDCGFPHITQEECEQKGCCYDAASPEGHVCYPKTKRGVAASDVFALMKNRTESRSRNACEGRRKKYKIAPLEKNPANRELENWCKKEWPEQSSERAPKKQLCLKSLSPTMTINKELKKGHVQIPMGAVEVEYQHSKTLSGGVNNMGVFIMQKSSTEDHFASYPDKLVLKLGKGGEFDREMACMQGTYGIDGLPKLYSDAFIFKGECYKGLVIELIEGRSWTDAMQHEPLDADSECELQETAGRLMCDIANRGFEEMDWNNPGNWILSEGNGGLPKFNRIDLGLCYKHFNIWDKEYRDAFWQQRAGPLTTSRWDMMWHMKKADKWGGNRLGVGDLILNSQRRIDVLEGRGPERPAPISTVYFPGNYVSQLGGEDWNPTYIHCKGQRSQSGNRFTLKLLDLKPGLYEFKAVIDPEKTKWGNQVGDGDGNFKFRITADKSLTTINYNAWSRTVAVDVVQPDDVSSISFPGDYVEQLGGNNWAPKDTHCLAHRDLDAATFYMQVSGLKPGDYFFKVAIDPEKNGWKNSVGDRQRGGNIKFRVPWWFKDRAAHESTTTIRYNSLTRAVDVDFVQPGDVSSVYFPGNYVEQLGGENWAPTDTHCMAQRDADETTFYLKVSNLKPGDYFFKALIDPEKRDSEEIWSENIGIEGKGGRDFRLHIAADTSEATFKYNSLTRVVAVDVA